MKTGVVTLSALIAFLLSGAAFAFSDKAAVVLVGDDHPYGCYTSLGDIPLSTNDEVHTVSTSSGITKLTCHFNIPPGYEPTQATKMEGFSCGIYLPGGTVYTTETRFLSSPGGRASLTCQVKK